MLDRSLIRCWRPRAFFFTDLPSRATAKFIAGRERDAHWTGTEFLSKIAGTPEPGWEKVLEMLAERDRLRISLMRQMETHRVLLLPRHRLELRRMPEAFFQEEGRDQVARFQGGLAGHPAQHVGPPEPP